MAMSNRCLILLCKEDREKDYNKLKEFLTKGSSFDAIVDPDDYDANEMAAKAEFNDLCVYIIDLNVPMDLRDGTDKKLEVILTKLHKIISEIMTLHPDADAIICGHFSVRFSSILESFDKIKNFNEDCKYFINAMDGVGKMVLTSYTRGGEWQTNADKLLIKLSDQMSADEIGEYFRMIYDSKMHECRALPIKKYINLLRVHLFAQAMNGEKISGTNFENFEECVNNILKRIEFIPQLSIYKNIFEELNKGKILDAEGFKECEECFYNIEEYIYRLSAC